LSAHITSTYDFSYDNGPPVSGVVGQNGFHHYTFEVGAGLTPTNWTVINSNANWLASVTMNGDTSLLPSGTYSVRLTAFDTNGARFEDRVILNFFHPNLIPPFHTGWPQSPGGANYTAPIIADLDSSGTSRVLWGRRFYMDVKRADGTEFPGWPQPLLDTPAGPPSVANLDGDGHAEVGIISSILPYDPSENEISLWHADGTPVPGWPKYFYWITYDLALESVSPVFADMDGDGKKDVIWCSSTAAGEAVINVDRYDGTPLPGWPVTLPAGSGPVLSTPAVGDVDGDGLPDIVVITIAGDVFLLGHDGKPFPGWPVHLDGEGSDSGVALADVDHDGQLEIFAETYEGTAGIFKASGEPLAGWPKRLVGIPRPPAFGDMDGDGRPEIAVGCGFGPLYLFHSDGSLVSGWPMWTGSSAPIIADLNGDGHLDILANSGGFLNAWDASGNELSDLGFPIPDAGFAPSIGDIDGSGGLQLLNIYSSSYQLRDLRSRINPSLTPWPTMMGDNAHQSRYAPTPRFSVAPYYVISNEAPQVTVYGDYFLKGMRVMLGTNFEPVISETVTSITFTVTEAMSPGLHNLTLSNVNSSSTTVSIAVVVPGSPGGDDDADGVPNWQELVAGTDPEDPRSFFTVNNVKPLNDGAVDLSWLSVTGRQYTIYYSTNLSSGFLVLSNSIGATPPTNHFIDLVGPQSPARFYRLGVQ
jgi:hypothetical protein